MTDLFPAISLGGVALLNLMARLDPPIAVRNMVVGILAFVLALYLLGELHIYWPDRIGLPAFALLSAGSLLIILWNWHSMRASRRG